ncbi:hypothetical protein ACS3SW_15190 [Roseobacteraceae bacterium S113]
MRFLALAFALLTLAACTGGRDLDKPPPPMGDFKLGHSIVVAPNLTQGPLSREATKEEWIEAVDKAFEDRFRRYDGERLYHFGISLEGYVLAQVGVPLVLQPKSVLIYRITVWDDEGEIKMNSEPKEITILEALSAESVVGSGLTQTREEQLDNLAIQAAKQAESWLLRQKRQERWFRGYRPTEEIDPEATEVDAALAEVPQEPVEEPVEEVLEEGSEEAAALVENESEALVVEPEAAVTDPEILLPDADDTVEAN